MLNYFLEWLIFFITAIPPELPVVLLVDAHSTHMDQKFLKLRKITTKFIYLLSPLITLKELLEQ